MVTNGAYRANYTNTLFHQSIYECHGLYFCRFLEPGLYGLIFRKAFRGYRAFSCDLSGNSALLSLKRFLLFRRKNKVIDHVSENRHLVPYGTLHSIYQALVQPHFNYCNIVWGNCGVNLQEKLQKLQNRAARVLTYTLTMALMSTIYLNS